MGTQLFLIDLEGTMYTRDGIIDGALGAISELRTNGHQVLFATNTDSQATSNLLSNLTRRGINITPNELFTPVVAASAALRKQPGAHVLALTSTEVRAELAQSVTIVASGDPATHVLVGDISDQLTYELLDAAFEALHNGAHLLALQKGRFYLSGGKAHLDTGGIVAALEYACDISATILGKPSLDFLNLAMRSGSWA